MDTTVDFRRKLLRFERPNYLDYARHTIPRYYSNFGPRFHTRFNHCDCVDQEVPLYPPKFAVSRVWEPECPCDVYLNELNLEMGHSGFVWFLALLILIVVVLMLSR